MIIDPIFKNDWHLKHLAEIYKFTNVVVLDGEDKITDVAIRSDELKSFKELIKATHPNAKMIIILMEDYKV